MSPVRKIAVYALSAISLIICGLAAYALLYNRQYLDQIRPFFPLGILAGALCPFFVITAKFKEKR